MDLAKVREDFPLDPNDPSSYLALEAIEFVEWDFVNGIPASGGKTYDFKEFLSLCVSTYQRVNSRGDDMLKYHQYIKDSFVAEGVSGDADTDSEVESEYHDARSQEQAIKECFDNLSYTTDTNLFKYKGVVMGLCGALLGLVSAFKLVTGLSRLFLEESGHYQGQKSKTSKVERKMAHSAKVKMSRRNARSMKRALRTGGFTAEAADNLSLPLKVVKRNLYSLFINGKLVGRILFIKGSTFAMPKHYEDIIATNFEEDEELEASFLNPVTGHVCFKFDWAMEMDRFEFEFDLVLLKLPLIYREHADLTNLFPSEKAMVDGNAYSCLFPVVRSDNLVFQRPEVKIGDCITYSGQQSNKLLYYAESDVGDCGTPLLTFDTRFSGPKILGIHTAGSRYFLRRKLCAGVMMTSEDITDACESLEENSQLVEDFEVDGQFDGEGFNLVRQDRKTQQPSKSKLGRSPIYGQLWDVVTRPARLTPFTNDQGVVVDPKVLARQKYSHTNPVVNSHMLEIATEIVAENILARNQLAPWEPRLFSYEEAVAGVPGVDFVDGVTRSTSPGYPFVLDIKQKGKTKWLGTEGEIDFDTVGAEEMKRIVDIALIKVKNGIRPSFVFMDCLKDERRPLEKVMIGKTRQFMACPIDLLVLMKMYFGDFFRHVCSNRVDNGVAVGIDCGTEWDRLYTHLKPHADYLAIAGDYASFDCKLPTQVLWAVYGMIERFYMPTSSVEDRAVRRLLYHEFVNSFHVDARGRIYEFIGGISSGICGTAVVNSICNLVMLVDACLKCGLSIDEFPLVKFTTFGDDHVIGYPRNFSDRLSTTKISQAIRDLFDYEYTDELKSHDLVDFRPLESVSFLKRGFKVVRGEIRAPLELAVLKETLNWMRNSSDMDQFKLRIESVCVELANHGESVFNAHVPRICKVVSRFMNYAVVNCVFDVAIKQRTFLGGDF